MLICRKRWVIAINDFYQSSKIAICSPQNCSTLLSPEVLFSDENTPKPVWWPSSARDHWGSLQRSPRSLAALRGLPPGEKDEREGAFLVITHQLIVRFQRNFVPGSRTACRQGLHDKSCKLLKSIMADDRHFENR